LNPAFRQEFQGLSAYSKINDKKLLNMFDPYGAIYTSPPNPLDCQCSSPERIPLSKKGGGQKAPEGKKRRRGAMCEEYLIIFPVSQTLVWETKKCATPLGSCMFFNLWL